MHDLVLIKKFTPLSDCWENLIRKKRINNLFVDEIIDKYQGFEGDLITSYLFTERESATTVNELIEKYKKIRITNNYLMLSVIYNSEIIPQTLKEQAYQVGYDVGICDFQEEAIYSSIFNEVLFGNLDELIRYKHQLNENFLFTNKSLADEYVSLHNELSAQGKDVEDYMEMTIYEIWKYR